MRCGWVTQDKLYQEYHDKEWGVPVHDDCRLFEFLILETFQAGLSWLTILKKREAFRKAFEGFDFEKVARFDEKKINELLLNQDIIRNQLKIRAAVKNAAAYIKIREKHGTFDAFIWQFTDGQSIQNHFKKQSEVPSHTSLSDKISKSLKQNGFTFVGTTIVYAHMQATGMVNDHITTCFRYMELLK